MSTGPYPPMPEYDPDVPDDRVSTPVTHAHPRGEMIFPSGTPQYVINRTRGDKIAHAVAWIFVGMVLTISGLVALGATVASH